MSSQDQIIEAIRKMSEASKVVYEYFSAEGASVRTILADTNQLLRNKQQLIAENEILKNRNEETAKMAIGIIEKAQHKAREIEGLIGQKLMEAERTREQAKEELLKAQDQAFMLRKKKVT